MATGNKAELLKTKIKGTDGTGGARNIGTTNENISAIISTNTSKDEDSQNGESSNQGNKRVCSTQKLG